MGCSATRGRGLGVQHQPGRSCGDPWVGSQEGGHMQPGDVWCHHSEMAVQGCPAVGTPLDTHHPPGPAPKGAGPALSTQSSHPPNPPGQGFAAPSLSRSEDQHSPASCDLCRGGNGTPGAGPGQHGTARSRLSPPSPAAKHPSPFQPVLFPATAASSVPMPGPGTEGFTVPCRAAGGDIPGLRAAHGGDGHSLLGGWMRPRRC